MMAVEPLLKLVRASCDGPLVVMKGPEIAVRYPDGARAFGDLDLLVSDARAVHGQLRSAGFVEVGDPEFYYRLHHLRPVAWPTLPLHVEVHSAPKWPDRFTAPAATDVIATAVPSAVGVDGVLAPDAARHTLLLAAHSWAHEPLRRLRDIVDICAIGAEADPVEVERIARSWRLDRVWRTTAAVARALLGEGPDPLALRLWARHLPAARERTVLENHLQRWVAGYWAYPTRTAARQMLDAMLADVRPAFDEEGRAKLARTAKALRNALTPRSQHDLLLGEDATRGRRRNPPEEAEPE
jgi:hypothetical protein